MRELMNLGKTPDGARNNPIKAMLSKFWNEPIDMIAEGLGTQIVSYDAKHAFANEAEPHAYDAAVAEEAWERGLAFLKAHL